jgi:hypothetical protein
MAQSRRSGQEGGNREMAAGPVCAMAMLKQCSNGAQVMLERCQLMSSMKSSECAEQACFLLVDAARRPVERATPVSIIDYLQRRRNSHGLLYQGHQDHG